MSKDINSIYIKVAKVAGLKKLNLSEKEKMAAILKGLAIIEKRVNEREREKEKTETKVNDILEVITALASLDFSKKARLTNYNDHFDAIALGINMLGEELQSSVISLREKEILLKEIHHRVKNNLQIISSLLNLQSEQIKDKELLERFEDSRKRLMTMALIHEQLYSSANLSLVNFGTYIEKLVYSLYGALHWTNITIDVDEHLSHFKIDTAIPCGLIVNELLTNCYKYAFPPGRKKKGNIKLQLGLAPRNNKSGNKLLLVIEDDGVGIPDSIDITNTKTLGLQLVQLLVGQLNGTLVLDKRKGTKFKILLNPS